MLGAWLATTWSDGGCGQYLAGKWWPPKLSASGAKMLTIIYYCLIPRFHTWFHFLMPMLYIGHACTRHACRSCTRHACRSCTRHACRSCTRHAWSCTRHACRSCRPACMQVMYAPVSHHRHHNQLVVQVNKTKTFPLPNMATRWELRTIISWWSCRSVTWPLSKQYQLLTTGSLTILRWRCHVPNSSSPNRCCVWQILWCVFQCEECSLFVVKCRNGQ
jgi:hypothetical protein